jgi:hypothetical protein
MSPIISSASGSGSASNSLYEPTPGPLPLVALASISNSVSRSVSRSEYKSEYKLKPEPESISWPKLIVEERVGVGLGYAFRLRVVRTVVGTVAVVEVLSFAFLTAIAITRARAPLTLDR